jgi:hypothetical protein
MPCRWAHECWVMVSYVFTCTHPGDDSTELVIDDSCWHTIKQTTHVQKPGSSGVGKMKVRRYWKMVCRQGQCEQPQKMHPVAEMCTLVCWHLVHETLLILSLTCLEVMRCLIARTSRWQKRSVHISRYDAVNIQADLSEDGELGQELL